MWRANLLEKTLILGKIKGRKRRGWQRKTVGCHHRLNGHEFEQTPGDSKGQGSLVCCGPRGPTGSQSQTRLSHWTTTTACALTHPPQASNQIVLTLPASVFEARFSHTHSWCSSFDFLRVWSLLGHHRLLPWTILPTLLVHQNTSVGSGMLDCCSTWLWGSLKEQWLPWSTLYLGVHPSVLAEPDTPPSPTRCSFPRGSG